MHTSIRTTLHRLILPLAALALLAALAPIAGAADCSMSPGANCQNQDMRHLGNAMKGADMHGANMRGADMRNMNLTGINLAGADMRGAKLSGATLNRANLTDTMMNGVRMKGVKLRGAMLVGTKLHMARLDNVTFDRSVFRTVDIRGTRFIGGGITNSTMVGTKAGPMPTARAARSSCANPTVFQGTGIGWAWENDYDFNGSTLTGDYTCAIFGGVTWGSATFMDANFTSTKYYHAQNNSEQIVAVNVDFTNAQFNEAFWRPGLAFRVNLTGASCPYVSGPAADGIWGRFNYSDPTLVSSAGAGLWKYGLNEAIGSSGYPTAVSVTNARLAVINAGHNEWFTDIGEYIKGAVDYGKVPENQRCLVRLKYGTTD